MSKRVYFNTITGNIYFMKIRSSDSPFCGLVVYINNINYFNIATLDYLGGGLNGNSSDWYNQNLTVNSGDLVNLSMFDSSEDLMCGVMDRIEYFNSDGSKVSPKEIKLFINQSSIIYNTTSLTSKTRINNFSQVLNNYLSSCNEGYNCSIPINIFSKTLGYINVSDVILRYTTQPIVNLVSPLNNTLISTPRTFSCNFTDATNLKNSTLIIWNGTSSIYNITNKTISGFYNSTDTKWDLMAVLNNF
jgi:hypothetical protein